MTANAGAPAKDLYSFLPAPQPSLGRMTPPVASQSTARSNSSCVVAPCVAVAATVYRRKASTLPSIRMRSPGCRTDATSASKSMVVALCTVEAVAPSSCSGPRASWHPSSEPKATTSITGAFAPRTDDVAPP